MPTGKHYCYETKNGGGAGKVIGEYRIWRIKRYDNVSMIPKGHIYSGCVPAEYLLSYSKGRPLYAHFIVDAIKYDKPKALNEFFYACDKPKGTDCSMCIDRRENKCKAITRPPQSWCFVEKGGEG